MTTPKDISPAGKKKLLALVLSVLLLFIVLPIIFMLLHKEEEQPLDSTPHSELVFSNGTEVFNTLGISTSNRTHIQTCAASLILDDQEAASSPAPNSDSATIYFATIESFEETLLNNDQVYSYSIAITVSDGRSYNLYYGYDQSTVGGEYIFVAIQSLKTGTTHLCPKPSKDTFADNAKAWTKSIPQINQDKLKLIP